ncbi:MAG: hypothetical protein QOG03_780 [Actinomycetota bacterium]|jgi:hypothetical protein|nr:hypothetical protein [Actinomycetota bacterium]
MSSTPSPADQTAVQVVTPDPVAPGGPAAQAEAAPDVEAVEQPAKVMRIGSMIKQLLDEIRQGPLDDASRKRLKDIFETSVRELATGLSPDLQDELSRLALPFAEDATPTDAELRIAQAQMVGWLEGLFHGIQATLFAQQMAARAQLEHMRQQSLPAGAEEGATARPGTYL